MGHIRALINRRREYKDCKSFYSKFDNVSKASFWQAIRLREKYRFAIAEYFQYRLYNYSDNKTIDFISNVEIDRIPKLLNKPEISSIFAQKDKTYEVFKKYYKRDLLKITSDKKEEFLEFIKKHSIFVIKPYNSHAGDGVRLVDALTINAEDFFSKSLKNYGGAFIIEEKIKQGKEISKLNASSINTLRVPTIRFDDEVLPHHIVLRCGTSNSIIDGMAEGGIQGAVNVKTGVIEKACNTQGAPITKHPTSNEDFVGFTIPKFDEAIALAKELAMVLPENRWIGWDLAYSEEGWIMVEGNSAPQLYIWERPSRKGIYYDIKSYFERLGMLDKFNEIVKR